MLKQAICITLCITMFFVTINCGTFWYPERKGQRGGSIDGKVVFMDVLMCFLFIIPGVIAFIIDIDNGCIYKPYGSAELTDPMDPELAGALPNIQVVFVNEDGMQVGENLQLNVDKYGKIQNIQEWRERSKAAYGAQIYYNGKLVEQPM
ncbi:MAG TPA: hypothetical protein PKM32_01765 [Planctomycetota bacterium]|nr:hypothetical protein [Planctomycetota bacterium]HON43996.1 hypothetical protein [Planctomycetota bacterium]HPY75990.1 hypothetical protein [Planctomycetota bacterium]HQB01534.1 hypothetical protein [Planctomycetota bacterium]HRU52705.1 hypothetical protein [Planctomycetota bacterium]